MSRALPTVARLAAWRHHLHRMPEIAFTEHKTSAFIAEQLASFGGDIEIRKGLGGGTGIVATIRGAGALAPDAARRAIALRADIDALPIEEEADVPFDLVFAPVRPPPARAVTFPAATMRCACSLLRCSCVTRVPALRCPFSLPHGAT